MIKVKLNAVFMEFHNMARHSVGPKTLHEYAAANNMTMDMAEKWKFALRAQDIIEQKLHPNIVGCTGRARVFSHLLSNKGIEHKVILTAIVSDLQHSDTKRIDGHQIIAVNIDGKMRMFDPAEKELNLIEGDVFIGRHFRYPFSDQEYVITNIMSSTEYDKIKSLPDLQNAYKQIFMHMRSQPNDNR
ncbi:MAG: hypothetical protein J6L47_03910 [Alphaproteobacteria bacterium]|nr:hypothetical protein [Alphaproteobacteria bacterium]